MASSYDWLLVNFFHLISAYLEWHYLCIIVAIHASCYWLFRVKRSEIVWSSGRTHCRPVDQLSGQYNSDYKFYNGWSALNLYYRSSLVLASPQLLWPAVLVDPFSPRLSLRVLSTTRAFHFMVLLTPCHSRLSDHTHTAIDGQTLWRT